MRQVKKETTKQVTVSKVTKVTAKNKASKKASITWKKVSNATGYEVQYSTSKTFAKSKTKTVTTKTNKVTLKKLKKNKKYYIRVRAYVKNEKTARKLFEQVVEYYIKYSQGYYNVFRKGQYNTEENWVKLEVSDERFTEIAAVEGTGYRFEGNKQVFVRIGNQIVCLRYFGESDVETLIEAIAAKFL